MQAKHLIIPQQINPFGAILKGMRITGKKKKKKKEQSLSDQQDVAASTKYFLPS